MADRFTRALPLLIQDLANRPSGLSSADTNALLNELKQSYNLPKSLSNNKLIEKLEAEGLLHEFRLEIPARKVVRYFTKALPLLAMIQESRPKGYFSHYTAMWLNNLTEQIPTTIYHRENTQRRGPISGELTQRGIDIAFANPIRKTNQYAEWKAQRICFLHGSNTDTPGITEMSIEGHLISVTDIERTLIDCAVRPIYAGGTAEVLKAFELAKELLSVNRLKSYLLEMGFIYPYHQAIGFYLERADYRESQLSLFDSIPKEFDFYLENQLKNPDYNQRWRLHIPQGF